MKIFVLVALMLSSTAAFAGRTYGDEIVITSPNVKKILKVMKRDTTGSNVDAALTNATSQCQIYIDDMIKAGQVVYSFRPYADTTASPYVYYGNCEATLKP